MALHQRWSVLGPILATVALVIVASLPWLGVGHSMRREIMLIALLVLVVSGLNLSFGFAGELALGQVFMYAAGAYVAGFLGKHSITNIFIVLALAGAAALILGLLTGAAGLRLGGWMLALSSLFLIDLIPHIANLLHDELGGYEGMSGIPRPDLGNAVPLNDAQFYVLVVLVCGLWLAVTRNLVKSREGTSFLILKESPTLARALGVSVFGTKLRAYALGAVPAGLAGALYALTDGYIAPAVFTFELGLVVLAASILGGSQSVYGAIVGAAILHVGPQQLDAFDDFSQVAYGVLLLVGGVLLGGGIAGLARRLLARALTVARSEVGTASVPASPPALPPLSGLALRSDGVTVRFGGFTALDGVSFEARPGRITSLIGPNGSGKTTMLNVVSGLLVPTGGQVVVGEDLVTGRRPAAGPHGLARTFQTPIVPMTLTTAAVAASGRIGEERVTLAETVLRLPRFRRQRAKDREVAREVLAAVGLASLAEVPAGTLPLGQRRLLEFARALAARPSVMLLDEVASGLDEAELADLDNLISGARAAGATVLLVEHNFELVRGISDHVVVLADGRLLAEGSADEIAENDDVKQIYFGTSVLQRERQTVEVAP